MSCYNSLPLAGGGSTLVRLNLKAIAERSESLDDFFTRTLPHYCQQQIAIIDARCEFLYQQSHFFENSFTVKEGLINPERFVPMFGMYGLAEAVNLLCEKEGIAARYGKEAAANEVGYRISAQLAEFVANTPVKYGWQNAPCYTHSRGSVPISAPRRARVYPMAMSQIRHPSANCRPASCLLLFRHQRHSDARRNHQT